ncbi:DUF5908 family protein [Flavobacterium sp. SUN052]|uniref:DUF5908 family protein n=1 Tax=Flavobacterium sp. SUN052 TaxID=3002441 RepID=UPI00237DB471|nr:DUF5908 family protein [Flavobacterium sp. SUN052]MEC4004871.1 DUF5908 family protein [Flavobacterium sp. SUN052]
MPIEIKELHIKVKIEESKDAFQTTLSINTLELESLKSSLVSECISKVLEKIKEREER